MGKTIFTNKDKEYMKNNYLTLSYREIGEHLGFTERQIRGWLNGNGYTKNRKINDDYFRNIDMPLKVYFLGFIYADGWICVNEKIRNYEFGMELQSEDKYILEKLNEELGGLNIIYHELGKKITICGKEVNKNESDVLRVYSKPLVLDLINNGVVTNKTQKDIYPVVPEDLFFDFLRGYIDGDGCYYTNKVVNTYMHITCASEVPLIYIKDKLKQYNIKTTIYTENERKHRLMCTNHESMVILINHLYSGDDLFCLKRKYERIKHLIGLAI